MSAPGLWWFYNSGSGDATAHEEGSGANDDWAAITVGSAGHTLVFTGPAANDGDASGTRDTIIIPAAGTKEIDKTFIDNAVTIEQVPLAGTDQGGQSGGDNRYVFCIYFDGETASKPYLEMWDNDSHNSVADEVLGNGTPGDSMVYGIVTTAAAPGSSNWSGHPDAVRMAGSGDANRLDINIGSAIGSAGGNVYWNQAVRVISTASPFSETPCLSIRYTYT